MIPRLLQGLLDGWGAAAVPNGSQDSGQKKLLAQPQQAQDAPEYRAETAVFRHPAAQRQLVLGGVLVAYALQRVRRRSIGFVVDAEGLTVRAPAGVALAEIEHALHGKAGWIVRKLHEVRVLQQRREAGRIAWVHGAQLPYLGAPLLLRLGVSQGARVRLVECGDERALQLALPHEAAAQQARAQVQAWFQRQARSHFTARLEHFAPQLEVRWQRLSLSSARTRWGSASADGSIRLNWRLMHYTPALIDYVVVHELAHLREMNHSPRFWRIVEGVLPDYAMRRQQLRAQPAPLWD
jgi:predicted metal-dependent hydrolase